jgi:glycine betaine/proline transport system substrate-binding protein
MKKVLMFIVTLLTVFTLTACMPDDPIVIGEGNWDSNVFHDQVAKIIIEEGYGYTVDIVPSDTTVTIASMKENDVNLSMEIWSENVPTYDDDVASGDLVELSTNFDDNTQGLYIPTYLQEEYPELVSVNDLVDYVDLFEDPEGGDLGIIYGGPEGWAATIHLHAKMEEYGLDEYFTFKTIDSSATLNATLAGAYANEEPWVGYNWEPTWALGMYDMVLLEDSAYDADDFENGIGAFPSVNVNVVVDSEFENKYPDLADVFSNYETSTAITNEALAYMQENDDNNGELAAIYFLENYEDLWSDWVTDDAYDNIINFIENK